jgi:hypothetical protein
MLVLWYADAETMRKQIRETRALTSKPAASSMVGITFNNSIGVCNRCAGSFSRSI